MTDKERNTAIFNFWCTNKTRQEAAEIIGCSERTIYNYCNGSNDVDLRIVADIYDELASSEVNIPDDEELSALLVPCKRKRGAKLGGKRNRSNGEAT